MSAMLVLKSASHDQMSAYRFAFCQPGADFKSNLVMAYVKSDIDVIQFSRFFVKTYVL